MKNITLELQQDIVTAMDSFRGMRNEGKDLYNLYWKGTVSSDISALADGDPASIEGELTKIDLTNGLAILEQMDNFWQNSAVTQADYNISIQKILHGDAVLGTALSADTEDYAARLVQFCTDMLTQYNRARGIINCYNACEVAAAVAAISTQTIVFGSEMTKDDLTSAVTLLSEIIDFIENAAVATGDYKATLAKWAKH